MKSQKLKNQIRFWTPAVLCAGVIFLFSSLPAKPVSEIYWREFAVKKTAHMVEYAIFSILLYRAFINTTDWSKKKAGIITIIIAVLYGMSDEFHQSFVPGREPRVRDVIFDTIGSVFIIFYIWKLLPKAPKKLKSLAENLQIK